MNQILVPTDGSHCTWGYPCVYQYYSYIFFAGLFVLAGTQFFVVKVLSIKSLLVATRSSVSFLIMMCIVVIQWRYLIAASQFVPKTMFAANLLHTLDCDSSTKGGKEFDSARDCFHGQLTNCTREIPCTVCNPINGMDDAAIWNWWVVSSDRPCPQCSSEVSSECTDYETGGSSCSKTFDGPLFDGAIRTDKIEGALNPVEFWRTKQVMSCGTCCSTNRTTAFLGLVKQALEISTATGLAPGDSFPNDPTTVTHPTRDSAWLFRMVREQYAIDPAWFLTPTLFPLDARDINITNNDGVREEYNAFFINEHWYRAVGGK